MSTSTGDSRKWICCQLGAREHYAIPRALFSRDLLGYLITDAWVPPSSVLAKFSAGGLADRFHGDLSDARVRAFNLSIILLEMGVRARRPAGWKTIIERNQWFQRKVLGALSSEICDRTSDPPILLSYSYAALELFRFAKSHGWNTLLLQIDPGPEEERIVAEEVERVPELAGEWQPAPVDYWSSWRQECNFADRIIVNSEWSRVGLMRSGIPREKLTVIPLAHEASELGDKKFEITQTRSYPARFTPGRPMRVLFLGQINLRKGVARLLQAAQTLRNEPVEFWFVGPVQIANAKTAANGARVKWFGPVTRRKTAEKYRAADVFILPTLSDGFAITQLEAQSYGLPVISTNCCGGVVENGRNGIILEDPGAACIAAAIRDCIADPNRLQALAAGSYRKTEFTITTLGERLQKLGSTL
jgi:glycosyltransferase involved in cell wall biosynthesis